MADMVQHLRVVIASPADVAAERSAVERVLKELNGTSAKDRNLYLEAARWETDAYPGFHLDGPQAICDSVLKIEDCDILVGVFWTRFGTPTADGMTGTEHEIQKAIEAWRRRASPQVMVFFNNAPPNLRSSTERRRWTSVAEYQEAFPAEGLFWNYAGSRNFEREFRRCLSNYLHRQFPLTNLRPLVNMATMQMARAAVNSTAGEWNISIDQSISDDKVQDVLQALASLIKAVGANGVLMKVSAGRGVQNG